MVTFILSCLDRGLICSRMFQGGERLGETTECRGLFRVISLIFIFTVNVESSIFACRTELRGWIFFTCLWLRCRSGVVILLPSFLSASFQWSFFPPFPGPRLEFPLWPFAALTPSTLFSSFLADPSSDGWAGTTFPAPLVGDCCSVSEGGLELRFTQAFYFGGGAGITFRGCSGFGGLEVGDWQSSSLLGVSFSRDFSLSLLRASVRSKWEGQSIKKKKKSIRFNLLESQEWKMVHIQVYCFPSLFLNTELTLAPSR